jgi:hypothetical protein
MKKFLMSFALILIITLSAEAQTKGGHAIKWYWWNSPAVVMLAAPWYEKLWNFIRDNMEAHMCYRTNSVLNCCWSCNHRVNHFAGDPKAKWFPPKK